MKKLFQSEWISRLIDASLPVFAAMAALLIGAVMLFFLKAGCDMKFQETMLIKSESALVSTMIGFDFWSRRLLLYLSLIHI